MNLKALCTKPAFPEGILELTIWDPALAGLARDFSF